MNGAHRIIVFFSVVALKFGQDSVALDQFITRKLETHDFLTCTLEVVGLVEYQYRVFNCQRQFFSDRRRQNVVVRDNSDVDICQFAPC